MTEWLGFLQRKTVLIIHLYFLSLQLCITPVTAASELSHCLRKGMPGMPYSSSSLQEVPTLYLQNCWRTLVLTSVEAQSHFRDLLTNCYLVLAFPQCMAIFRLWRNLSSICIINLWPDACLRFVGLICF